MEELFGCERYTGGVDATEVGIKFIWLMSGSVDPNREGGNNRCAGVERSPK